MLIGEQCSHKAYVPGIVYPAHCCKHAQGQASSPEKVVQLVIKAEEPFAQRPDPEPHAGP